jgi:hypothetical protein
MQATVAKDLLMSYDFIFIRVVMRITGKGLETLALTVVGTAFSLSLLRMYVVPPILSVATALWSIFTPIIVIGVIAFYIAKGSPLFSVGLIVLTFAFLSSVWATVGTFGEDWRVVAMLEENPDQYILWIRIGFFYGFLPIMTGLALCVLAYVKQRKIPQGSLGNMLLLTTGGFFTVWGIHYFRFAYRDYVRAVDWAVQLNINNINDSLQIIYGVYGWVGVLWFVAGTFLIATSVYTLYKLRSIRA